jgi:uncharacterized protein YfaS (alpha-2-macroglobulin family)
MNSHDAERADAYLHGLMDPREAQTFERELADDAELRAALESAKRRLAAVEASLPPAEASERLVRETLQRIDSYEGLRPRRQRKFWLGFLTPVAAAALVIGCLHFYFYNLSASSANLEILGQARLLPGTEAALRVRLTNRNDHRPLPGVPVDVTIRDPQGQKSVSLASFTTDDQGNGQPTFQLPDWPDGQYILFISAQTPDQPEILSQRVDLRRSAKLMLTTDKPKYQPGQTIHVRSLTLLRPDLKPAADSNAVFTVTDPKGNVIFREAKRTSRFGIAAVDCELADELIEGNYRIHCRAGDTDSSATVEVHKYVLPKMKIAVTTERPWYLNGDEVHGTIEATYIHGEPVADGEWLLEVRAPEAGNIVLGQTKARTGLDGKGTFSFNLPDKFLGKRDAARVSLQVTVQDRAGQQHSKTATVAVASQALHFEVIPESGQLVRGLPNTLYVYASTPDGTPAKVQGTLFVAGTPKEFSTTELGVAAIELTPSEWTVALTVQATDARRRAASKQVTLTCGQIVPDFLLRTNKAVYEGGDSMTLTALGGASEPVFVDILKDQQTIRSSMIEVKDGKGELVFDLPAELFGTLTLCAYRFDSQGNPVRKTRAIYVRPVKQLNIAVKPDKPEYRPGEKANLAFTLSDAQGKPVPGALSLAMVDEAVFELVSQMPGMERTFYLLEQELLKPVYTIYPWTPEDDPRRETRERQQFEQALFASTTATISNPSRAYSNSTGVFTEPAPSAASPHTLASSSYQIKAQEIGQRRHVGLDRVRIAWLALGVLLAIAVDVFCWMHMRWIWMAAFHFVAALVGAFCLLAILMIGTKAGATFARVGSALGSPGAMQETMAVGSKMLAPNESSVQGAPVRVRERFPETLFWQPQLITDDNGHASVNIELADSITTWRLSASAVSADGRLGALQSNLRAFQPFFVDLNLPVSLTRNDEVEIPAVVSNFLPRAQSVELKLHVGDWFELSGPASRKLELKPREVTSVTFKLKVKKVGRHELQLTARSADLADAVKRTIEVLPDGRPVERVVNGTLTQPASMSLELPEEAIEGSGKAIVRIYPSSFSQLVEGLDGIFQLPNGCFEQTSSSLYPNVMALSYLRQTGKSVPEVEAKARHYIHVGYQRLLRFEVPGGGFDWYGHPPANVRLTAYGLMEFRDMAKVHDVDPALIERTWTWLMRQRNSDGSWSDGPRIRHSPEIPEDARLHATAYIAWAVFDGEHSADAAPTRQFLLQHAPESITDPYELALVCNALLVIDAKDSAVQPYLQRLLELQKTSADGRHTRWELARGGRTAFYGAGGCGHVETTALAVLALLKADQQASAVRSALTWLAEQRRNGGHWGSTQATILALKALLAGTGKTVGDGQRTIEIALDDQVVQTLDIPPDQAEVLKQIDLSSRLKVGRQKLMLRDASGAGTGFQVTFRYHVPGEPAPPKNEPLTIELKYERQQVSVGEMLTATAIVTNHTNQRAPMVMVDLPIPAGFTLDEESIKVSAVPILGPPKGTPEQGTLGRFQLTPRQLIVYLRGLDPGAVALITYRLKPTLPATVAVPQARVYEYYDPSREGRSAGAKLTVTAK